MNVIRQSGDLVAMTVVSAITGDAGSQANYRQCATLPSKLSKKGKIQTFNLDKVVSRIH